MGGKKSKNKIIGASIYIYFFHFWNSIFIVGKIGSIPFIVNSFMGHNEYWNFYWVMSTILLGHFTFNLYPLGSFQLLRHRPKIQFQSYFIKRRKRKKKSYLLKVTYALIILDIWFQNRVSYSRVVKLLNSFENVLINKIVWVLVLFFFKKIPF